MTMHADQLVGATVTDSDGRGVGTVEQVFRDDVDGTPSWARIRSARGLHFVPLAGSRVTSGGRISIPFDSQKIMDEPDIKVDRHMSVEQEERLGAYFGVRVPAQPSPPAQEQIKAARTQLGQMRQGRPRADQGQAARVRPARAGSALAEQAQAEGIQPSTEWLVRSEERLAVDIETRETGRVILRKFVDTEPVQQSVRVFHEEYVVERVPIGKDDQVSAQIAESQQELILHEARPNISKATIPVEKVRLGVRKVEEDKTVRGELRKERIEIDDSGSSPRSSAT